MYCTMLILARTGIEPGTSAVHLPANSGRTGYATEGALFIAAQLSTDAVGALRKVWTYTVWKQHETSTHVNIRRIRPGLKKKKKERKKERRKKERKKSRLDSNYFGFICAGVNNVVSYERNVRYNLSCLLHTYCRLTINEKLFVS